MVVPSLCSTTEKLPERLILTVFSVSRLVAVPTNGPAPKILPSPKTKKFWTSGAVGSMRTGKLHVSLSVSGTYHDPLHERLRGASRPRESEHPEYQGRNDP